VEEDKFPKVACSQTRIAFGSGGDCLKGYRLASEADTLIFALTNSLAEDISPAVAMLIVIGVMIRKIFRT